MDTTQLILIGIGALSTISSLFSWLTRQQIQITKLEMDSRLAAMELRLNEKISSSFVTWQAHNDLEKRVARVEG